MVTKNSAGNILDLMVKTEEVKTIWVNFIDNFEVELKYLPRSELQKIAKRSTVSGWERHQKVDKLDDDNYLRNFVEKTMVSWRGLTQKTLAKIIPVKVTNPDEELIFSVENAFQLLKNAYDLDTFVTNAVMDLSRFTEEAEKKI